MPTKKIVLSNDAVLLTILQNSFFQREGFGMVSVRDDQTGLQAVEAEAPARSTTRPAGLQPQRPVVTGLQRLAWPAFAPHHHCHHTARSR